MYAVLSPPAAGCLVLLDSRRSQPPRTPVPAVRRKLGEELHAMLARDAEHRRRSRVVRRLQTTLRASLTEEGWGRYLTLEEAELARGAHALERVARWAFARGRRSTRSRR
jgi:hypothetical protein